MLRGLKMIVLAFKPISDAEAMRMNLDGPQPPKRKRGARVWERVEEYWKCLQIGQQQ